MAGITRTDFTRQYEHVAVIAHGAHPEYRVEFDAPVALTIGGGTTSAVEDAKKIRQGSVVHVNVDGAYEIGGGTGSGVNYPVPCISLKNVADPDVTAGVEGATYRTSTYSAIGGIITAIPCTAGYEIETTEYVGTTFKPGDALIAATGDDIGKVKIATKQPYQASGASEPILGFVSKVPLTATAESNRFGTKPSYDYNRLSFFTNFIPAAN